MSTISKTSFYHERLYRYTLTSTTEEDEKKTERKKLKEMAESPLGEEVFQFGLKNFAKTAAGEHYSFLTLELASYGIFSILVRDDASYACYIPFKIFKIGHRKIHSSAAS